MTKETLYVSGIITPTPEHPSREANKQRFVDKGVELSADYAVFLPGENNGRMGQQLNWTWRDFLKSDIPFLLKCDVIYMLLDWETSRGARLEHWLAKRYHKQVIYETPNKKTTEAAA